MSDGSHFEQQRTEITSGAWYAPTRDSQSPNYVGAEFSGYRVLRRKPSPNHTARWEIVCLKCGVKKDTCSTNIKRGLDSKLGKRIGPCKCGHIDGDIPLNREAVFDLYGIRVDQLRVVLAVLAHEKLFGFPPTRLEVVKVVKNHASAASLVRKGWLKTEGMPMRMSATAKAWRELA